MAPPGSGGPLPAIGSGPVNTTGFVDVLFLRHATPEYPFEQFPDPFAMPLSSVGREEAAAAAAAVARFGPQAAFVSDFLRTVETAAIALRGTSVELQLSPELRERTFFSLVGMTFADIVQAHGEPARHIFTGNSDKVDLHGEETYEAARRRVVAFVEGLSPAHNGRRVLVVSHGGPHAWLVAAAGGTSLRGVRTAGIGMGHCSRFRVNGSSIRVMAKNLTPEEVLA